MPQPRAGSRILDAITAAGDHAPRYGVVSLGVTAVTLVVLAARPDLVPAAAALLFAGAMVGVATGMLILCEHRRRALAEAVTIERRLAFLVEAGEVLSSSLNYETTLRSLARLTVPYLADWCAIDMVQDDDSFRRLAIVHRDPARAGAAPALRPGDAPERDDAHGLPWVLRTGRPEFVPNSSYMCVPLVARGRTLGALSIAYATADRRYTRDDLALAEAVARRAGLAVDNARLFRDAETASQAKDEFLAAVSHELRTPLHAMLGWTRMLRTGNLDAATTTRALDTLDRNTRLQAQLIEDLLDVSRVVTGKMRIDVQPVDLDRVVAAALESVRAAADAKGIHLEAHVDAAAGRVSGDAERLQQVVWNLLANAVKFTPQGGRVRIGVDVAGGHARIQVADTGVGVEPDLLPHLFERFRQTHGPDVGTPAGLGLGLAIVRHIVELHGGTVHAESPGPDRGTTFTITLPSRAPREG